MLFWSYESVLQIDPYPSIADALFLIAYPLLAAGIYMSFVSAGVKIYRVKKSLLAILLITSMVLAALVMYFVEYQLFDAETGLLSTTVHILYGVGDLVLIVLAMLAVLVASEYKGGKLESFWLIMAIGFVIILLADIVFAVYLAEILEDIKPYTYVDLLFFAGYQFLTFGMLQNYLHISSVQAKIRAKLLPKIDQKQ
jgi:hypothetical protein